MFKQIIKNKLCKISAIFSIVTASLALPNTVNATIVEFQTSQGNFQVNLYDQSTPKTVANFLSYVDSLHYSNSVIHRVSAGFIVQGGGFTFNGTLPLTRLAANTPVINEAIYSNITGTIAMAKLGSDMNSATDQWFFNLKDNSTNLDRQNGGFTVFGQVIGNGIEVVNKIAELPLCFATSSGGIPMAIEDGTTCSDLTAPGMENFVVIEQVVIVDSSEVTDSDLTPLLSKYPDSNGNGIKDIDEPKDSGGSITWFSLCLLSLLTMRKRLTKR